MLLTGGLVDRRGARVLPMTLAALAGAAALPALADSVATLGGRAARARDRVGRGRRRDQRRGRRARGRTQHAADAGRPRRSSRPVSSSARSGSGWHARSVRGGFACLAAIAVLVLVGGGAEPRPRASRAAGLAGRRIPQAARLSRAAIPLGIACAAAFLIEGGIESWSALFLERELDAGPAVGALGPAAYGGAMMIGRFSGQWLERVLDDTRLLAGAATVAGCGLVVAALSQAAPVAIVAFFLGGAGVSIAAPALLGAAGRRVGQRRPGRLRRDRDDDRLPRLPRRPAARGSRGRGSRAQSGLRRPRPGRRRARGGDPEALPRPRA